MPRQVRSTPDQDGALVPEMLRSSPVTRPWPAHLGGVVATLLLAAAIFVVVTTFVAQPFRVEQTSMEHTLEPDQYVLIDKLTPQFGGYRRGDIVVFLPPPAWGDEYPFIKRVIGVAGDTVEIRNDRVFVDGIALSEPYVDQDQPTLAQGPQTTWVVPPGELFVIGDHRLQSADSRVFGPIQRSSVIGRAFLRYWPPDTLKILGT